MSVEDRLQTDAGALVGGPGRPVLKAARSSCKIQTRKEGVCPLLPHHLHPVFCPFLTLTAVYKGLPRRLSRKESACVVGDAGDVGSIPGSGRSPGGGHGHPLWYSCLENPMDRGAWRAYSPRGRKESDMTE